MNNDDMYSKGYTLEYSIWGVSVYRTIDGSPGHSESPVQQVGMKNFGAPVSNDEACAAGWELAAADHIKRKFES